MNTRRLVVTGAGGFVGSWIVRRAIRAGYQVHGVVRPGSAVERLHDCTNAIAIHEADLRDSARLGTLIKEIEPAMVVHAAFPGRHASGADARREMLESGVGGTANLLEAIRSAGTVESFVHVGSAMAYGPSERPHCAADPLRPITFRGACKAASTLLCRQYSAETGTRCPEVRLFTAYGPWEQPALLLPSLLRAALQGPAVRLTAQPHRRNWIYVEDAAEACLAALQSTRSGTPVFNACTNEMSSTHELARLLEGITGRTLVGGYDYAVIDAYRDPNPQAEMPAASDGINWRPRHTLGEGLTKTWAWAQTAEGRRHLGGA